MDAPRDHITRLALATLTEQERERAVLYLDDRLLRAGDAFGTGRSNAVAPHAGYVVFVDLEPEANWGHACRYLLVDAEGDRVEARPATMPPFLKGAPATLSMLWKGALVPSWAVAVP